MKYTSEASPYINILEAENTQYYNHQEIRWGWRVQTIMKDSTILVKNYPNQLEKENNSIRIKVNKYVFLLQGDILNWTFTE